MNKPGPTMVRVNGNPINFYEFFEVDRNATPEELKTAYRKMCVRMHPDKDRTNPRAEENFKVVQGVWDVLSDPHKREQYDIQIGIARRREGIEIRISIHDFDLNAMTSAYSSWHGNVNSGTTTR